MFKIESEDPAIPGRWATVETAHNYPTAIQVAHRLFEAGAKSVRWYDPAYPTQKTYIPSPPRRTSD
jgi:hypothetical protein